MAQKEDAVEQAYQKIRHIVSPSFDSYGDQIKEILNRVFDLGTSSGEAEAYRDAAKDIKDLNEQIRDLTNEVQELRGL